MEKKVINIGILASGSGSNAENIIQFAQENDLLKVTCVISDKENAKVLWRADRLGVPGYLVEKKKKEERVAFEARIIEILEKYQVEWICLAGFMRLLSPFFLQHYYDSELKQARVLNIHPSLLPKFPGKDAYLQAFNANVKQSGVTIHFVNKEMDGGRIILQRSFKRLEHDTVEDFERRGRMLEYSMYRQVLSELAHDKQRLLERKME